VKTQRSNGPITRLIRGSDVQKSAPGAIIVMQRLGQNDPVLFSGEIIRVAAQRKTIGKKPVKWNSEAVEFKQEHGHRLRVFCASLADVFDNQVPSSWRKDLFALIRECGRLDWLLLTKRPQNISKMLPSNWGDGYPNVWLGMTAEDQTYFDQRWKHLQKIPAVIKFISYEPAIGPLRLPKYGPFPDWLISGGESGGGARPVKRRWIQDVIADCRDHDVAVFHKQWGTYQNNPLVVKRGMTIEDAKVLDNTGRAAAWLMASLSENFRWRRIPLIGTRLNVALQPLSDN
jgi:protein gp37